MGKTLFEKVWDEHVVDTIDKGPSILYIDKHLIHEVTSPQAFNGLNNITVNMSNNTLTYLNIQYAPLAFTVGLNSSFFVLENNIPKMFHCILLTVRFFYSSILLKFFLQFCN